MTERQRRFAARNHNLIYRFLHEKGWEVSEYYDIAAFGYLRAVRRYLTEPGLHHPTAAVPGCGGTGQPQGV